MSALSRYQIFASCEHSTDEQDKPPSRRAGFLAALRGILYLPEADFMTEQPAAVRLTRVTCHKDAQSDRRDFSLGFVLHCSQSLSKTPDKRGRVWAENRSW